MGLNRVPNKYFMGGTNLCMTMLFEGGCVFPVAKGWGDHPICSEGHYPKFSHEEKRFRHMNKPKHDISPSCFMLGVANGGNLIVGRCANSVVKLAGGQHEGG